jgi:hypothetical protein
VYTALDGATPMMLGRLLYINLCQVLARLPQPDIRTTVGLAATVLGFIAGLVSLALTILIYRWTTISDDERHAELKDALAGMRALLGELAPRAPDLRDDLGQLSLAEQRELRALLQPQEEIVRVARSGSGKGNHPWQAFTTTGRVVQVYTGGRKGGVHAKVLD